MRQVHRFALSAMLACGILLPLPFSSQAAAPKEQDWIDGDQLYSHVEKLSSTPRPPATETEFAAGVYVENTLRSYGYETKLQPFFYYTYRKPSTVSLSIDGWPDQKWNSFGFTFGPNGAGKGTIADCGYGTAADFQRTNIQGKIALVQRGGSTFAEIVRQAAAAGAVAVIVQNNQDGEWRGSLGEPLDMAVPVIALSKEDGSRLRERMKTNKEVKASVQVEGSLTSKQTSYNIIAVRKPVQGGTGQTVLVTAHHDSAPLSPGANNGASGVAVLLEMARVLAERPLDTELRLVSFGGVSAGERGPIAYAESLTAAEKQQIIAAFCLDGVGSVDAGDLIVTTRKDVQNLPARLASEAGALYSTAWDDRSQAEGDHLPLEAAGIPSALLTCAPVDTWRDQPEDTAEKVSRERLLQAAQVVLSAVGQIVAADSPAYPVHAGAQAKESEHGSEEYK